MSCLSCVGASSATFLIKRGDLDPSFRAQVMSASMADSLAAALSARFILRDRRTGQLAVSNIMVIEDQTLNPGVVRYDWAAGDTAFPGFFVAEIEVIWGDGRTQTFPSGCFLSVIVARDLDVSDSDVNDFLPTGAQVFEGHGPPTDVPGSSPGDQYLDLDTGNIYELED